MLRSLFTTLTKAGIRLNLGSKFVIGRIQWAGNLQKKIGKSCIVKHRHSVIKVDIHEAHQSLAVSMLPYEEENHERVAATSTLQLSECPRWRIFSKEEILKFVVDVNDENPIHRTEQPLVPGCLLVESWVRDKVPSENEMSLSFRFHGGVYSDECTYIIEANNESKIYTDRGLAFVVSSGGPTEVEKDDNP